MIDIAAKFYVIEHAVGIILFIVFAIVGGWYIFTHKDEFK